MVNRMDEDQGTLPEQQILCIFLFKFKEVKERITTDFAASAFSFHLTGLMKRITMILFWGGETYFFYIIRNLNTFPTPILSHT